MLFVTWRLRGSLRQKPHCASIASIDRLLDRAPGEPQALADPRIATIVKETLLRYHNELYSLHSWVIMHNHIHLLMEPKAGIAYIARTIMNETDDLSGLELWARESYERTITAEAGEIAHRIENHPVRSGFVSRPEEWEWSSAHADPYGRRRVSKPLAA